MFLLRSQIIVVLPCSLPIGDGPSALREGWPRHNADIFKTTTDRYAHKSYIQYATNSSSTLDQDNASRNMDRRCLRVFLQLCLETRYQCVHARPGMEYPETAHRCSASSCARGMPSTTTHPWYLHYAQSGCRGTGHRQGCAAVDVVSLQVGHPQTNGAHFTRTLSPELLKQEISAVDYRLDVQFSILQPCRCRLQPEIKRVFLYEHTGRQRV